MNKNIQTARWFTWTNWLEITALISFIFFGLMLVNISREGIDQNIVSAAGVIVGVSAAVWHHERNSRLRQESLLMALSMQLLNFFNVSESCKDSYLYHNNHALNQSPSLLQYANLSSKKETQDMMKQDTYLLLRIKQYLNQEPATYSASGLPIFSFGEFSSAIYIQEIDMYLNGFETTLLKENLLNLQNKISLCNRYINDSSINNQFNRLLEAIVAVDILIKQSMTELKHFKFVQRFSRLTQNPDYATLMQRILPS